MRVLDSTTSQSTNMWLEQRSEVLPVPSHPIKIPVNLAKRVSPSSDPTAARVCGSEQGEEE